MLVPLSDPPTNEEVASIFANARRELRDCLLLAIDDTVNLTELLTRIDQQIAILALLDYVKPAAGSEGSARALAAEFSLLREQIRQE